MKCIIIVPENQQKLASKYNILPEDLNDLLPMGYHLVADFGDGKPFEVLTLAKFNEKFVSTGVKLRHGWFEIRKK